MKKLIIAIMLLIFLSPISLLAYEKIYNSQHRLQYYVKDNKIYSKDWSLKFHIRDGKIYDKGWKLKYYIKEGK